VVGLLSYVPRQTLCSQSGQVLTPKCYYEIPTSRKEEHGCPLNRLLDCCIETGAGCRSQVPESIMMIKCFVIVKNNVIGTYTVSFLASVDACGNVRLTHNLTSHCVKTHCRFM
jgi:hypothetical protein